MTLSAFLFAALSLLLTPGPTNALMALNGAAGGWLRTMRLIAAELLGYLTAILPLVYMGAEIFGRWPIVAVALRVVAAAWVLFLAFKLWKVPGRTDSAGQVTTRNVYFTTAPFAVAEWSLATMAETSASQGAGIQPQFTATRNVARYLYSTEMSGATLRTQSLDPNMHRGR